MIELSQAIGIAPPDPLKNFDRHRAVIALVQDWIDAGADPDTIRKTVSDKLAATSSNPHSLRWFDGAVRDAIRSRVAAARSPELTAALKMAESINAG